MDVIINTIEYSVNYSIINAGQFLRYRKFIVFWKKLISSTKKLFSPLPSTHPPITILGFTTTVNRVKIYVHVNTRLLGRKIIPSLSSSSYSYLKNKF